MKQTLLKSWLLMMCLLVGVGTSWAEKITDYTNIVSGKKYYIGATSSSTDYYLSVDGSSTSTSIAGTAVTDKSNATAFVFEGSGTSWTIKFDGTSNYLGLKSSKDNGKVQVVSSAATFTLSNQSGKIRLTIGSYSVQKNNSGTQFGSYGNTQTDVWLEEVADAVPHTVTFNAGINGTCSTTSLTEISAGAGVTLPSVTANDGWVFQGWSTSATPTSANAGAAGATYKPSSDCTLYAYYKEIPNAPAFSPVAGEVEKGTSVTFSSTTDGCTFRYTTDGSDPDAKTGTESSSFTVNDATNLKVVAVKDGVVSTVSSASYTVATHTATFNINGNVTNAQVAKGDAIPFPANPSVDDVEFIGWTKNAITGTIDNAPSDICTSATMGAEDVTYYAVFASVVSTTFDPNDLTNTPSNGDLSWKNSTTGVQLKLSAGQLYTSGTPKTFTVSVGAKNYFQVTSENAPISKIVTTVSNTDYKIQSVSDGATLTTSGTTQTITCSSSDVKAYPTTTKQIRATKIVVTTASDFCTTVKAVTSVVVKTAPTTVAYCEGEKFDPTGLEVTLTYEDATTKDVAYSDATASKFTFAPALDVALTTSDDHVAITINGQTANQTISVRSVSISAPVVAEGTYTVKVGDAETVTADGNTINALKGQKIVLASTPATGYKLHSTPFVVKDEDDANVSVSTAGGQYSFTMPGKNVTITAQFTRVYTITAGSCQHGSITAIKDKDDAEITETSYLSKVVVSAEAAEHYHLTGMYYVKEGDDAHNEISENEGVYSFTMPQSNVTVYATFADDTQYTVSWMVNGAEAKSEQVYADVPVSAPAVEPINGKVFRGWVADEITGTSDDAPSFVNVNGLTVSEDKVFYAVFATEEGTPETHNIITYDTENFPSSYAAAADYTLNGVSFNIVQAYVNGQKTQWRASGNSNGTGTMYNNDAMDISKITLTYDNSDNYKNFTIKVGNGANPTSGTEITGVVDANDNKVYVFDCTSENASYFVLTNGTNAGYLASIDITCGGASYSDFTTAPCGIAKISIGQYEYATLVAPCNLDLEGTGVTAYAITSTDLGNSVVRTTEVTKVPAGKPIIVHGAQGDYNIHGIAEADDFETMLEASESVVVYGEDTANDYYYLGVNGDKVCFKKLTSGSLAAGKCFFKIAKGSEVKMFSIVIDDDDATGISSVNNKRNGDGVVYNLAGQRVDVNTKGIIIVNGKKMLNK